MSALCGVFCYHETRMLEEAEINNQDSQRFDQIEILARQVFGEGMDLDEPILGMTDDIIVAENIHEMIHNPANTLGTLVEDENVIGFSLAIPIGVMDPAREAESAETAYIYFTGVDPKRQGEGLVGEVMKNLVEQLRTKGYSFAERDCLLAGGYADNVEKTYKDSIVEKYNHTRWPEIGPERFFRIDLTKL